MTDPNRRMDDSSIFWRIPTPDRGRVAASMVEIAADGTIPREVDLDDDGKPIRITRPGDYRVGKDASLPATPPRGAQFDECWGPLASALSRDDFEAIYARADAALPPRGNPGRMSLLAGLALIVVAIAATVALLAGSLADVLRTVFGLT